MGSEEQVAEEIILLLILTLVFIYFNFNKLLFEIHCVPTCDLTGAVLNIGCSADS